MRMGIFRVQLALAVALALVFALPARSFERQGFRSCMTLAEAQAVAARTGQTLTRDHPWPPLEEGGMGDAYIVGKSTDPDMSLVFAAGKLIRVSRNMKGGFETFATTLEASIDQLGQPSLEARAPYSIILATWSIGKERQTLSVSKPVDEIILVSTLDHIDRRDCR